MRLILIAAIAIGFTGCATQRRQLSPAARAVIETPADDYDSHTPESEDANAAALRAVFEKGLAPSVRARLVHDPRLDVAARVELEHFVEKEESLPVDRMQWVLWRVGVPGRAVFYRVWESASDSDLTLTAEGAEGALAQHPEPLSYGIFRGETASGSFGQSVMIASRTIELTAMPRRVGSAAIVPIKGRVTVPAQSLRVSFFSANVLHHVDAPLGEGGSFSVELTAPVEAGRYHLDFSDPKTNQALATVNLFVAMGEPSEPVGFDAEVQTARLKARLAELRAEQGKQPNADFALEALARANATRVCTLNDDPEDHVQLTTGITGLGHGNSVISSAVTATPPFVLQRDPTGDEPDWVTAVATCEIAKGAGEGKQYVIIISAKPGL